MKIAYFGYDFFHSCLETLVEDGHEVIKIFTYVTDNKYNFNEKVISIADSIRAPVQFCKPRRSDIDELFTVHGCELLVVAAYPFKIPVGDPERRGINIHPSLLPQGRGPWPLPWVILKGLKRSGVTIHKLENDMDGGDILSQHEFNISDDEDLETLSCKCQLSAAALLRDLLSKFERKWEHARRQTKGTYWRSPTTVDQTLDWSKNVAEISRTIRAIGKFESRALFDEKYWVVQDGKVWKQLHKLTPGTVAHRTNKEIVIAAKDGFVCLRFFEVDPEPDV